jgi:hypothetical protein
MDADRSVLTNLMGRCVQFIDILNLQIKLPQQFERKIIYDFMGDRSSKTTGKGKIKVVRSINETGTFGPKQSNVNSYGENIT